jgi:hypothetical protein
MLPYKYLPTVEILYRLFGNQLYDTTRSNVLPAEFMPDEPAPVRVFVADPIADQQPFVLAGPEFNTIR